MQKLLAMLTAILLLTGQLLAQKNVTGKVIDEKGNPIPNASVIVKGTSTGTSTRSDGTFTLPVAAGAKWPAVGSGPRSLEKAGARASRAKARGEAGPGPKVLRSGMAAPQRHSTE